MDPRSDGLLRLRLEGEIERSDVADLERRAISDAPEVEIDLAEAEVADGAVNAELVAALRRIAAGRRLRLLRPPQVLAHVIYRVGLAGRIVMVEPRVEEPTSS